MVMNVQWLDAASMSKRKITPHKVFGAPSACLVLLLQAFSYQAYAADYYVVNTQELTSTGGRVAWSPAANNLIAFDRESSNGFYDTWTMNPDGTNQVCLTCGKPGLPPYNKGNPDWRPQGDYLVIQVQASSSSTDPTAEQNVDARPGAGGNNVVYIMDATGTYYWEVAASESGHGVLHAHFSHDGTKLIWAQLINENIGSSGEWEIQYAAFTPGASAGDPPTVSLISSLTPGITPAYYETHGFSLDDTTIFFSGTAAGQPMFGTDIYSYNLNTGAFADLTNTPTYWDEHSRPNPVEEKLLFASSFGTSGAANVLKLDYWTMNYDGSDKKRVTWFQDPLSPTSLPGFIASDNDWNHDGTQEVIYLNDVGANTTGLGGTGAIYLLTLAVSSTTANSGDYVAYPQAPDGLVSTFGVNLSSGTSVASGSLPTELGSTTVTVTDSGGTARSAQLVFVSPSQVNWVVPAGSRSGPATVTTTSGSTVSTDIFDIENVGPSIFTIGGSGAGAPAAYVLTYSSTGTQTGSQNAYSCSGGACTTSALNVAGGQSYLILYATGVRHYSSGVLALIGPSLVAGFTQMNVDQSSAVQFTPAYAGSQNTETGLDQLNIQLPATLAGSGTMYLQLKVDDLYLSNTVQLQFQ
jgi:uncharacterized protein (TIGR03437 family)